MSAIIPVVPGSADLIPVRPARIPGSSCHGNSLAGTLIFVPFSWRKRQFRGQNRTKLPTERENPGALPLSAARAVTTTGSSVPAGERPTHDLPVSMGDTHFRGTAGRSENARLRYFLFAAPSWRGWAGRGRAFDDPSPFTRVQAARVPAR